MNHLGIFLLAGMGLTFSTIFSGCSPKVYLIDRQTILEQEAAGEWPDFESELIEESTAPTPVFFDRSHPSEKKSRVYQIPNGDFVSTPAVDKTQSTKSTRVKGTSKGSQE